MIKAVLFDCFGVFYIDPGHHFIDMATEHTPESRPVIEDLNNQVDYGLISQAEYVRQVAGLVHMPLAEVRAKLLHGSVRNQRLVALSQKLRQNYKIALVSNISRGTMDRFFAPHERRELFDEVILSSEVGMIKPHPEIFEYACQKLGVDVSEAVMVDDIETNCAGAVLAGLKAVHYKRYMQAKQELLSLLSDK